MVIISLYIYISNHYVQHAKLIQGYIQWIYPSKIGRGGQCWPYLGCSSQLSYPLPYTPSPLPHGTEGKKKSFQQPKDSIIVAVGWLREYFLQERALGQWAVASTFSKGLRGDPNHYIQQSCRNTGKLRIPSRKKEHGKLGLKWSLERNLVTGRMGVEKAHFILKLLRNSRINGGSTWLRCEICFFTTFLFAH